MARNKRKRLGFLPYWRVFTYFILAFNLAMLIWVVAGTSSATHNPDCGNGLSKATCQAATDTGAAIGATFIVVLWVIGDIILGILWLITNRRKVRDCPVCGQDVRRGVIVCGSCGHDFRSGIPAPAPPATPQAW